MRDEVKNPETAEAAGPACNTCRDTGQVDMGMGFEACVDCPKPEETSKAQATWEYKTEFGIAAKMREVIEVTVKVAETEIERYKRKIEKLTYGS